MRYSWLAALGLLLLTAVGCQSGVSAQLALAQLASSCRINSDCDALLVCAFQRCHQECATTRDCEGGAHCVGGDQPRHVCQLESERSCTASGACPGSEVCGADGLCRDGCRSDRDCVTEQLCAAGTCADQSELSDSGTLPVASGQEALPVPCQYNSDCAGALLCLAGTCRSECSTDDDCPAGKTCENTRCVAPVVSAPACLYNSDCKEGRRCLAGACALLPPAAECQFDSDCSTQHCVGGACTCECSRNADCPGTYICQAGCACVPGRVISGNVTISNTAQLRDLDDVVEVTGTLLFAMPNNQVPASYRLPTLRKVGAIANKQTYSSTPASYTFAALEEVGSLGCAVCRVPVLKKADTISYSHGEGAQVSVDLPELRSVEKLTLQSGGGGDTNGVIALRAPKLTHAPYIGVSSSYALTTFSAPALTDTNTLSFTANGALTTLDLSALKHAGDVTFQGNYALKVLELPAATTAGSLTFDVVPLSSPRFPRLVSVKSLSANGSMKMVDLSALEQVTDTLTLMSVDELALPHLASVGTFTVSQSSALKHLALPALATVGNFSSNAPLQDLSLPVLTTAGNISLIGTQLSDLSAFDPALGSTLQSAGDLTFLNNPALPICAGDALSKNLPAWAGTLTNTGNLACSCPGVSCCTGAVCP